MNHFFLRHLSEEPFYTDDHLPFSYETGFQLCIAATVVLSVFYAIYMAVYLHPCTGVAALCACASVAAIASGGTARTKEVTSGGNWTAVGMGALFYSMMYLMVWAFAATSAHEAERAEYHCEPTAERTQPLCGRCCNCKKYGHWYWISLNLSFLATSALIAGLVVLTVYCKRMDSVEEYDYYGPMYINSVDTVFYDWYEPCQNDQGTCVGFHGVVNVSWGMEWGCPYYSEGRWCSDIATDHDCTKDVCEHPGLPGYGLPGPTGPDCEGEEHYPEGKNYTLQCLVDKYNLSSWENELESVSYNRSIPPNHEGSSIWPHGMIYGDCTTCTASVEIPYESAQDLWPIGKGLTLTGLSVDAFLILVALVTSFRCSSLVHRVEASTAPPPVSPPPTYPASWGLTQPVVDPGKTKRASEQPIVYAGRTKSGEYK